MNRNFFYIAISIFLFIFLTKFIFHISHLFALLVIAIVLGWVIYNDNWHQTVSDEGRAEMIKHLNDLLYTDSYTTINDDFIVRPPVYGSYLENDMALVNFYERLSDYSNYNLPSYRKSLLNANNLLGIEHFVNHSDYSVKSLHQYLEQAEVEYKEALNNMHSLIYSIPTTYITHYTFNNSMQKLEHLLIQHLDNIKNLAKRQFDQCDLNIHSKPIHDYFAAPNDQTEKGYSMNFSLY